MRKFVDFLDFKLFPALASASAWSFVWVVTFLGLTYVLYRYDLSTATSALVVTLTVVSGHATKYIAYLAHTDTDFRRSSKRWSIVSLHRWRILFTTVLLVSVIVMLAKAPPGSGLFEQFDPAVTTHFIDHTWPNFNLCLLLFTAQLVFSWPEGEILSGQGL